MRSLLLLLTFFTQLAWACPPCPSGASNSGRGATTTSVICKCDNLSATWNGTSCVLSTGCGAVSVPWLTNCSASPSASANGAVLIGVANQASGYTGTATLTCSSGIWNASSASCSASVSGCTGGAQSWVMLANTCNGTNANAVNGASSSATDADAGTNGTASFLCTNGAWSVQGTPTCNASCASSTPTWTVSASCSATHAAATHSNQVMASDATGPDTGSANYLCSNGGWSIQVGSTCSAAATPCPSGQSCYADERWVNGGGVCTAPASLAYTFGLGFIGCYASTPGGGTCTSGSHWAPWNPANSGGVCSQAPAGPVGCTFNGSPVAHASTVTAYLAASGGTCTSEVRTCTDGTLSGSYTFASCTPSGGANCLYGKPSVWEEGQMQCTSDGPYSPNYVLNHGDTVILYPQGCKDMWTGLYPATCGGDQTMTCTNGVISVTNQTCNNGGF